MNQWDYIRAKNPLVRRNAQVSAYGVNYRVASIDAGGVRLRNEIIVHPADIRKPRRGIVVLCGSTRFSEAYQHANLTETLKGFIVLTIGCDMKGDAALFADKSPEELERIKTNLDELHLCKIDMADIVYILNVGGYVGESTRREIAYARRLGKPIRWLEPDKAIGWE